MTTGEVSKCCESVCPVCFNYSVCSVFAGVVKPEDNSDIEPMPMSRSDSEHMSSSAGVDSINTDVPCEVKDGISEVKLVIDQKLKESFKEVRELQLKDPNLALYLSYLEQNTLPDDDHVAKTIVLESRRMKVIDGVLYREDVSDAGRWCVVVSKPLRQELLEEAHSTVYAGHFLERKVYDRLRRTYWWYDMRADVRFYRGCLSCASRKGPGHGVRPLLQPISEDSIGVDVLKLPLTSSGNQYLVVFLDYLTKCVEANPVPNQQAETIAHLVENSV